MAEDDKSGSGTTRRDQPRGGKWCAGSLAGGFGATDWDGDVVQSVWKSRVSTSDSGKGNGASESAAVGHERGRGRTPTR